MAQYKTGTVSLQHDMHGVYGSNTNWTAAIAQVGNLFMIKGEPNIYKISGFVNQSRITLERRYQSLDGNDVLNKEYLIVQDYTTNMKLPLLYKTDWNWVPLINYAIRKIDTALYHYGVDEISAAGIDQLRFATVPSGSFTEVSGGWSYYTPHSSVPVKPGVLFFDGYYNSYLFCNGDTASACPAGATSEDEKFYYTVWYRLRRWGAD